MRWQRMIEKNAFEYAGEITTPRPSWRGIF
jgi:hypothetical protein